MTQNQDLSTNSGSHSSPKKAAMNEPKKPVKVPVKINIPRSNIKKTQKLISEIENQLQMPAICYYTSPKTSIKTIDADMFVDRLKNIGKKDKLALVLISSGGSGAASLRIASIIREYSQQIIALIPSICASAATMLALAADKIFMSPAGYLTAIDSSLRHPLNPLDPNRMPVSVSVDQVQRVINFLQKEKENTNIEKAEGEYTTLFKYIHPLAIGEIDRGSALSELVAFKMMKMHPQSFESDEQMKQIAKHLVSGYPMHAFPILYDEAKELGLPVEKTDLKLADILWDLVKTYNVSTMPATTHISSTHYRFESLPVIIESAGTRTSFRISYYKRLNETTRRWQTENDVSQWVNLIPPESPGESGKMVPIDAPITSAPTSENMPTVGAAPKKALSVESPQPQPLDRGGTDPSEIQF